MSKSGTKLLSPSQLEIMNLVWERTEATVADVWKALGERRKLARNTVQTVMTRLEESGWLKHREGGQTFYYRAAKPRNEVLSSMVAKLVDSAFGGSADGLVMALLEGRGVSEVEAQRIQRLIKQAEKERP